MYGANELAYIAHFIIVPAHGLYELFVANSQHFGLGGIEQLTKMGSDHVAAYNFIFSITKAFI